MTSFPRRHRTNRLLATAAVSGLALLAAACSSGSNSSAPSTSGASSGSNVTTSGAPVTLRLGYLTNLTHAAALVGLQQGILAKNLPSNVTLQTTSYNAGPAEVTALLAGSLDAAYMGPNSAITAYTQGNKAIGSDIGRGFLRRGSKHHLGRSAKGQDGRHASAGEHPRRGLANVADQAGPELPGS